MIIIQYLSMATSLVICEVPTFANLFEQIQSHLAATYPILEVLEVRHFHL